jgi:hypothetical protein
MTNIGFFLQSGDPTAPQNQETITRGTLPPSTIIHQDLAFYHQQVENIDKKNGSASS